MKYNCLIEKGNKEFFRATGVGIGKFKKYRERFIEFRKRTRRARCLEPEDELLLYFIRKKRGMPFRDLSREFLISKSSANKIFLEISNFFELIRTT